MDTDKTPSSAIRGRVLIVSILLDAWLLFHGRALSRAGYDVTIISNADPSLNDADHRDILKYFLSQPFCRLIDFKDVPKFPEMRHDFAIVGLRGSSTLEEKRKLLALTAATPLRAVVLRQYNNRFPAMARMVLKDILHPFIRRSSRVLVEEYMEASWTLRFLTSTSRLGVVPHQRVICQGLPKGLGDRTDRAFLFNFLGSYSGPRVPIIDRLESRFQISRGGEQHVNLGGKTFRMMWHADRPGSTRARPLHEYLDALGSSFFTLSLPGYEIITHRALEAIHCGSIPVLPADSISHYLIPLEHGRNCWLVKGDDWESTLAELGALNREQVLEMQRAVKDLACNEASIPSLEKRSLRQLGLNGA